jgi:hypothetical protein
MNPRILKTSVVLASVLCATATFAQSNTPPISVAELETFYTSTIEERTAGIVKDLNLTNDVTATVVHDLLIAQYRVMRARDELIDAQLRAMDKDINYKNRESQLLAESKPLHAYFFAKLGEKLTPEQVEKVKDKMTYNKVKVTYDAYVAIVPGLKDEEKAKILEWLKAAREEAVDGGSAPEKSSIFQKYKDQINDYLNANGHDTVKAFKDWTDAHPSTNNPAAK